MNNPNSTERRTAKRGEDKPSSNTITAAVIGAAGAIAAAFVGGLFTGHATSPQPAATVYITKTATAPAENRSPTGGSTAANSPVGTSGDNDTVLWKGKLLIGPSGITFNTIPPSQPSVLPQIYWQTNPNQLFTPGVTIAPWNGKKMPTEGECQTQSDTQAYPADYKLTNPRLPMGLCIDDTNVGDNIHREIFLQLQEVTSSGIETAATIWAMPGS